MEKENLLSIVVCVLCMAAWWGEGWVRKGAFIAMAGAALCYGSAALAGASALQVEGAVVVGAGLGAVVGLILAYLDGDLVQRWIERQLSDKK